MCGGIFCETVQYSFAAGHLHVHISFRSQTISVAAGELLNGIIEIGFVFTHEEEHMLDRMILLRSKDICALVLQAPLGAITRDQLIRLFGILQRQLAMLGLRGMKHVSPHIPRITFQFICHFCLRGSQLSQRLVFQGFLRHFIPV